jgi:hypothetical protein
VTSDPITAVTATTAARMAAAATSEPRASAEISQYQPADDEQREDGDKSQDE